MPGCSFFTAFAINDRGFNQENIHKSALSVLSVLRQVRDWRHSQRFQSLTLLTDFFYNISSFINNHSDLDTSTKILIYEVAKKMYIDSDASVHEDGIQIGPFENDSWLDTESWQGCWFLQE